MGVFFDEALDDVPTPDQCPSFAGGQYSNSRSNLIGENQAAQLINCDISKTGEISTRRGTTRLGAGTAGGAYIQGLAYFETPSYNYPVAAAGGKLNSFDGTNWNLFANTWTANDMTGRVLFAQGIDKLYFTDRVGHLWSWDGATAVDLGGSGNAFPPPSPSAIAWHTDRLCVAGGPTDPDAIYFSQFLDGATFDRAKWQIRVGAGEGDAITGLFPWLDYNLIVFKRHSVWIVNMDPLATGGSDPLNVVTSYTIKCIHKKIGCIAPNSAAQIGTDVFFLSDTGIRTVSRTVYTQVQTDIGEPKSLAIQDIINRINLNAAATISGFFWNNRYFIGLPLDGSATPNYVLVYSSLLDAWSGLWTGWTPTAFAIRNVSGNVPRLMFGDASGNVNEWLDYVQTSAEVDATFQDAGIDIPVTIKTRAMTFGEPFNPKTGLNAEFEFNASTAQVLVNVVRDDAGNEAFQSFATLTESLNLPVVLPFILPRAGISRQAFDLQRYSPFRELQFVITTTRQKMVLRSIYASAFIDTFQLQSA
jgi:hypothetical protein